MKAKKYLCLISAFAFLLGTLAILAAETTQDSAQSKDNRTMTQKCLACHGSFDALAEKTAKYKTPSEETATPHRYVPHAEKTDIPECIECHIPHPVPLEDKSQVVKPKDIPYCFNSCHHAHNLQPCKNCH